MITIIISGHTLTIGSINTREVLVFTLTHLEGTIFSLIGCIVGTSNTIIDVLAVVRSMVIRTSRITDFETEGVATHEATKT